MKKKQTTESENRTQTIRKPKTHYQDEYLSGYSPRYREWEERRAQGDAVANVLAEGELRHQNKARRIRLCSERLKLRSVHRPDGTSREVVQTYRCRSRQCPTCQRIRAVRWRARVRRVVSQMVECYPDAEFIALTLTVRNRSVDELKEMRKHMHSAWQRFIQRVAWPATGWLRTLEITKSDDETVHPHFHVILMVDPTYFRRSSKSSSYLTQEQWTQLWQECLRVSYRPRVDVRRVKWPSIHPPSSSRSQGVFSKKKRAKQQPTSTPSTEEKTAVLLKAICYDLKTDDLDKLTEDPAWFLTYDDQVHKARAIAVGGLFKPFFQNAQRDMQAEAKQIYQADADGKSSEWHWQGDARRYRRGALPRTISFCEHRSS